MRAIPRGGSGPGAEQGSSVNPRDPAHVSYPRELGRGDVALAVWSPQPISFTRFQNPSLSPSCAWRGSPVVATRVDSLRKSAAFRRSPLGFVKFA